MPTLESLVLNDFCSAVFRDGAKVIKKFDVKPPVEWPDNATLDESEFYVQKLGFHLAHELTWCKQLDLAIEFLSNYDYSKKASSNRADHLIYNIENNLIRLNSVYDRTLQLVNATFHLCLHEEHVSHEAIIKNYKITHRPDVPKALMRIKKRLSDYAQARHSLIHKHSLMDADLQRIEMFYLEGMEDARDGIKNFRAKHLRDYISEKKKEFLKINSELAVLLGELFSLLLIEYNQQKKRLGWSLND